MSNYAFYAKLLKNSKYFVKKKLKSYFHMYNFKELHKFFFCTFSMGITHCLETISRKKIDIYGGLALH